MDDLILSVSVGVATALRKPWSRLGALAAGVGAVAVINSVDDDPTNDPAVVIDRVRQRIGDIGDEPGPSSDMPAGDLGSPVRTWAIIGGAVLGLIGLAKIDQKVLKKTPSRVAAGLVTGTATYLYCQSVA
ncbi:hypothetical protein [Corynebacterium sp. H130]|uniref:hypothetical protein n=1 Tax=Corynebacterium sp. H130 TaxID=3133444 RepID=UPI0030B0EBD4